MLRGPLALDIGLQVLLAGLDDAVELIHHDAALILVLCLLGLLNGGHGVLDADVDLFDTGGGGDNSVGAIVELAIHHHDEGIVEVGQLAVLFTEPMWWMAD